MSAEVELSESSSMAGHLLGSTLFLAGAFLQQQTHYKRTYA